MALHIASGAQEGVTYCKNNQKNTNTSETGLQRIKKKNVPYLQKLYDRDLDICALYVIVETQTSYFVIR